jgi:hypothetical protein
MTPFEMIAGGNFTLTTALIASGVNVMCQAQNPPDFVIARNLNTWGKLNTANNIQWFWEQSMGNGFANGILQSSSGSAPAMISYTSGTTASDAISCYDTTNPPTYSALATTNIASNTGTYVVTMANTGTISVGDYVRLYSTTGALQLSGYTFQVTAVSSNVSITLGYMATSGITTAAAATAGSVVKFIPQRFYPRLRRIANITQAAQAKVYFMEQNDFTVGEKVSFRIPNAFGMTQLNNMPVRVLAVTNSATESSIVLDISSTGFTAFTFPTSAVYAAGVSQAVCVPSSSTVVPISAANTSPVQPPGTNLLDAFDNRNVRIIRFGSALWNTASYASANGDEWSWQAFKYADYQNGTTV